MIRVTKSQAAMLFDNQRRSTTKAAGSPRVRRPKAELPENILEAQITSFLRAKGWYLKRCHVGLFVPFSILRNPGQAVRHISIGEKGESDWMAYRGPDSSGVCELFFWEAKAPGKKPSAEQLTWLSNRRALGFLADWFDDFDDSPGEAHSFLERYRKRFE